MDTHIAQLQRALHAQVRRETHTRIMRGTDYTLHKAQAYTLQLWREKHEAIINTVHTMPTMKPTWKKHQTYEPTPTPKPRTTTVLTLTDKAHNAICIKAEATHPRNPYVPHAVNITHTLFTATAHVVVPHTTIYTLDGKQYTGEDVRQIAAPGCVYELDSIHIK